MIFLPFQYREPVNFAEDSIPAVDVELHSLSTPWFLLWIPTGVRIPKNIKRHNRREWKPIAGNTKNPKERDGKQTKTGGGEQPPGPNKVGKVCQKAEILTAKSPNKQTVKQSATET